MGRRLPPQLRACILRPFLKRCLVSSSGAATPNPVPRCFASAATIETRSSPIAPAFHPSAFSRGPLFLSSVGSRKFCSTNTTANVVASSSAGSHIIVVESADHFDSSLNKVQEGSLPAIFYFSATWCAPCKFLAPVVNELSKMYPPCVTYKIDIDMVRRVVICCGHLFLNFGRNEFED